MTNPDRWLQSCAEDYMDEEGDHAEMRDQEHSMVLKEIIGGQITPDEFEIFELLFDDQSDLLKALARNDGTTVLVIMQKRFDERVESLVEFRLEY
jgi:hypothetical protein